MVAVGKVLHGLELLVDDANAGFVGAVDDAFDVGGCLAHFLELDVEALGGFDGGLGVEFSCLVISMTSTTTVTVTIWMTYQGRRP